MNLERRRTVCTHNEGRLKVFLCQTLLACLEEYHVRIYLSRIGRGLVPEAVGVFR